MNTDSKNVLNSASKEDNDEIDLMALLFAILRGWKTIVFFAVLGLIIGILYSRYVNPTFQSDALIQVDKKPQGISASTSGDISELLSGESSSAQKEIELIRSRMILEPVINSLHLRIELTDLETGVIDKILGNRILTQVNTREAVSLETTRGKVKISRFNVSQSYLDQPFILMREGDGFRLVTGFDEFKGRFNELYQFRGSNGRINIIVNDLPDEGYSIGIRKKSLHATTTDINKVLKVEELGRQTGIIQLTITDPSQQQATFILSHIIESYIKQNKSRDSEETRKTINFMEKQIPSLKRKLEDSEATFNDFRERNGTIDISQEAKLLVEENSKIDVQLNELNLKKAELTTYYTEEHPLVIQINDQIKALNNRIGEIKTDKVKLPRMQREFLKLSEESAINKDLYLTMLKNYEQLKIIEAGQVSNVHIVDLPISSYTDVAPKRITFTLIGIILGILVGIISVLFRKLFNNVVRDSRRLERLTGIDIVATIPHSSLLNSLNKKKNSQNKLLSYADNNGTSYEAIKTLRTNLIYGTVSFEKIDKRSKIILITSDSLNVGKSFIALNLVEVFAQLSKKTLIIDADMRLGELHKVFNIDQYNGLADYLTQYTKKLLKDTDQASSNLEDFIRPTGIDNVDFMSCGEYSNNSASLLTNGSFDHLMKELNIYYDYIIIESPPILVASDAMILAQYVDKVLMVIRYNYSAEKQIVYSVNQMRNVNVEVDGIILNDVKQGSISKVRNIYSNNN